MSNRITSPRIYAILEQLYEDLNSYAETSIPVDQTKPYVTTGQLQNARLEEFNSSIEIKLLPFFCNPPPVHDWVVPLALIDLNKRTEKLETHWDLTIIRVIPFIDGVNHVSKIAHLADCDLELTRLAVAHLLQVVRAQFPVKC